MPRRRARVWYDCRSDEHTFVRGCSDGWYVCVWCGAVAVCWHCLPDVSADAAIGVSECYCDAEQQRLKIGPYAKQSDG